MNTTERILSEYAQILEMKFWERYLFEIAKYRDTRSDMLETSPLDKVASIQGEIRALKYVQDLPEKIVAELTKQEV